MAEKCYGNGTTFVGQEMLHGVPFTGLQVLRRKGSVCWCFAKRSGLRGPAAILFISRDTCSDSIAKLFCACFYRDRTIIARYVAK